MLRNTYSYLECPLFLLNGNLILHPRLSQKLFSILKRKLFCIKRSASSKKWHYMYPLPTNPSITALTNQILHRHIFIKASNLPDRWCTMPQHFLSCLFDHAEWWRANSLRKPSRSWCTARLERAEWTRNSVGSRWRAPSLMESHRHIRESYYPFCASLRRFTLFPFEGIDETNDGKLIWRSASGYKLSFYVENFIFLKLMKNARVQLIIGWKIGFAFALVYLVFILLACQSPMLLLLQHYTHSYRLS